MTTPLIILCLLLVPLLATVAIGGADWARLGGALGLAAAFAFFGTGHFALTGSMVEMLPPFVPFATALVYLTGLLELAIAAGLLHPRSRRDAGRLAILVLVAFFPVNVYAAIHQLGGGGHAWGPAYLLIRAPLQALLIGWAWWFVVRPGPAGPSPLTARGTA
jgi:uncharacterized membrane protein